MTGLNPSPASFSGEESPGTTVTLDQGAYNVDEGVVAGYTKTLGAGCSGYVNPGDSKTCTITNDDVQPKLIVIKHVINNNGRTNVAGDWTMSVTGSSPNPANFPGSESGKTVMLNAGAYSVAESGPAGYVASYSADCNGSIGIGQTKTCTVTNDDLPQDPVIILKRPRV